MPDENPAGKPLGDERSERREDKPADTTAKESDAKNSDGKESDGKSPEPPEP